MLNHVMIGANDIQKTKALNMGYNCNIFKLIIN